jgi:hypothetical protein
MTSTLDRFKYCGFPPVETPRNQCVYAAPVDNKEAHRAVDACQTIRNYPGIFEGIRRSAMRRVEACTESHGGHLSPYCNCTVSAITHKLNVSGHVLIWTFFPVMVCGTRAQSLSPPSSYERGD